MARYDSFTDQLRTAIRICGKSGYRICKDTGIDQGSMSRFLAGKGLSLEHIDTLVEYLGLKLAKKRNGK